MSPEACFTIVAPTPNLAHLIASALAPLRVLGLAVWVEGTTLVVLQGPAEVVNAAISMVRERVCEVGGAWAIQQTQEVE